MRPNAREKSEPTPSPSKLRTLIRWNLERMMKEIGDEIPETDSLAVRLMVTEEIAGMRVGMQERNND